MDSFRRIRTKVFSEKAERNKIVRRSASLPQIFHPIYFGSTPLTVDKINADVPLNYYNNPGSTGVYDISRHPEKTSRQKVFNNTSSTKPPSYTKPTTKPIHVNIRKPTFDPLNKPLPAIQKQPPTRVPRTATRRAEKPVPVPIPILKPMTAAHVYNREDLISQFPLPPASFQHHDSRLNAINHAEKEPLLARQIRRPTDPANYIPPPIPAFDSRSRIREIKIQMEEADRDPFRHIIPVYAAAGSTPNLFRSASTSSRMVKQDLPESWSELGDWTGYRANKPPLPVSTHKAHEATLLMKHNNISSKSLGPNVVFKDSPARRPILVHKKSSSFATPGYWQEPAQRARIQSNASASPPLYRSGSRRLPRVGDNTSRIRQAEDEVMQSTGSTRSVQSNISALSRAKKLPRPPLERDAQSSNMLSTGSAKSFMSLRSNITPRAPEKSPSRNVLKKLTKPKDPIVKTSSSSNMLSTGSARSFFSMRSNLIPESERKPRPVIKLPTALRPFKRSP